MYKYLIVECNPLCDAYETDAARTPICMTNDYSKYGYNYEVYEVSENGSLKLIKDHETPIEMGYAIYYWGADEDAENRDNPPTVLKKFPNATCKDAKVFLKELKKLNLCFSESDKEVVHAIKTCLTYGEEVDGKWLVIGEYEDTRFMYGY